MPNKPVFADCVVFPTALPNKLVPVVALLLVDPGPNPKPVLAGVLLLFPNKLVPVVFVVFEPKPPKAVPVAFAVLLLPKRLVPVVALAPNPPAAFVVLLLPKRLGVLVLAPKRPVELLVLFAPKVVFGAPKPGLLDAPKPPLGAAVLPKRGRFELLGAVLLVLNPPKVLEDPKLPD